MGGKSGGGSSPNYTVPAPVPSSVPKEAANVDWQRLASILGAHTLAGEKLPVGAPPTPAPAAPAPQQTGPQTMGRPSWADFLNLAGAGGPDASSG